MTGADDGTGNSPAGPRPSGGSGNGPRRGEVATYNFPVTGETIRTVVVEGEPWFVARDACAALGIVNGSDAVGRLDADGVGTTDLIDGMGRSQSARIVSEAGLYELIFISRKPEARAFRRWVTTEVLPAIRRTGSYSAPLDELEVARRYVAEIEARRALEVKVAELEPAAAAWDVLASASGDYSVREAAFILNRDSGISTGQQRLFRTLREFKMLSRGDLPYATHARHLVLRASSYTHGDEERTSVQVRVTADGLRYLHKRMGGTGQLDASPPTLSVVA